MKPGVPYVFVFLFCAAGWLSAEPVVHDPYGAEHAEIARLIKEIDYLSREARGLHQRFSREPKSIRFNYDRLIGILDHESRLMREFLNLKYLQPLTVEGADGGL